MVADQRSAVGTVARALRYAHKLSYNASVLEYAHVKPHCPQALAIVATGTGLEGYGVKHKHD